ncbi:hypothetical protein scyTo_0003764 [Scyliorhinus torazame]|uniref:Uncharacterized protein n=1 Tax=Scyliorhinus torazame TaxID=75743 RepID=A0A401PNH5_SCYTO|nr:hypothetical protein [Scyliorhinus torazame]
MKFVTRSWDHVARSSSVKHFHDADTVKNEEENLMELDDIEADLNRRMTELHQAGLISLLQFFNETAVSL